MKIIHLPTTVGGNSTGLSLGEREIGLDSRVLIKYNNWLNYEGDITLFKDFPKNKKEKLLNYTKIMKTFLEIRNSYDTFHFNFGSSLIDMDKLPLLELPFYKKKSKIVVTYNGCDARQKYPTMNRVKLSACHYDKCYEGMCNSGELDKKRQIKIKKFETWADICFYLNPDLAYFLPENAVFLPYTVANWSKIETEKYSSVGKKLKIVHAPTNRVTKGSDIIISALENIKKKYGDIIEIIFVENMPNDKALEVYKTADLIIDQILIGWYGGFAVEVMKMGKPVMTFIREEDLKYIPKEMSNDCLSSIININSENIFEKLCQIIENSSLLKSYRESALEYVYKWHLPSYVAGITKKYYSK